MSASFGEYLKAKLIAQGLLEPSQAIGCTQAEIDAIRLAHRVRVLPTIYREFLRHMGHYAGPHLFAGWNYAWVDLFSLKTNARYLLTRDQAGFDLPADAFVFLLIPGQSFLYFLARDHDDDPQVFEYLIGHRAPIRTWLSLSSFFEQSIISLSPSRPEDDDSRDIQSSAG